MQEPSDQALFCVKTMKVWVHASMDGCVCMWVPDQDTEGGTPRAVDLCLFYKWECDKSLKTESDISISAPHTQ